MKPGERLRKIAAELREIGNSESDSMSAEMIERAIRQVLGAASRAEEREHRLMREAFSHPVTKVNRG